MTDTRKFSTAGEIRDYLAGILARAEHGELSAREASGIAALARVQLRCIELADDPERVVVAFSEDDPFNFMTTVKMRREGADILERMSFCR